MSLFRNRNKSFEEKLGNQFEGLEYKPSESLWDKISSNVPEDSFETAVSDRVNTYQPKPYPETWEQIESQLPPERNRNNRKIYWFSLLLLLLGTTFYLANELNKQQTKAIVVADRKDDRTKSLYNNIEQDKNIKNTEAPKLTETKTANKKSNAVNPPATNDLAQTTTQKVFITEHPKEAQKKTVVEKREPNQYSIRAIASEANTNIVSNKLLKEETTTDAYQSSKAIRSANQSTGTPLSLVNNDKTKLDPKKDNSEQAKQIFSDTAFNIVSSEQQSQELSEKANTSNSSGSTTNVVETKDNKGGNSSLTNEALATNDSVITSTNNKKKDSNNEITRFSITVLTGMHYCFNSLSAPSNTTINFSDNIALRRKLEKPELDWSGAFLLDYAITTKWRLSTGLMISNFSQSFQFATANPTGNHANLNEPNATVTNPNDSIITGTGNNNRIKYTWTEIPLFISYSFSQKGKLGFDVMGGVSYAFINGVDASYVSYNNIGVLQVKDNNSFPGVKNNFFVHLNPTVLYKINNLISLGMAPTFKYSLTSITGKDNWVQQHPYFVGLSVSLRKHF